MLSLGDSMASLDRIGMERRLNGKVRPRSSSDRWATRRCAPAGIAGRLIPAARCHAYSPLAFPDQGGFARHRVAGERRCSWRTAVAGLMPWRDRRRSGQTGRPRPSPDLKHDAGTIRQPCAGRGGGCWRCFDTSTSTSTSARSRRLRRHLVPRIPLDTLSTRKPRGDQPDGAFGALGPAAMMRGGHASPKIRRPARPCRSSAPAAALW